MRRLVLPLLVGLTACLSSSTPADPGDGSDGGPPDAGAEAGTVDADAGCSEVPSPACEAYADALVALHARCGFVIPAHVGLTPVAADFETWKRGLATDCARDDHLPFALPMPPECATDLAAVTCESVELAPLVESCRRKGTGAAGRACERPVQCASGICLDGAPAAPKRCAGSCGGEGAACGYAHGQDRGCCEDGLLCIIGPDPGTCQKVEPTRLVPEGAECRLPKVECDPKKGLACSLGDGGTHTCTRIAFAEEGAECNVSPSDAHCAAGLFCKDRRCVETFAEGAPCAADYECGWPARCVSDERAVRRCSSKICPSSL